MQGPRAPEVQAEPEETGKDSPDIVSLATAGPAPRRVESIVEVKTPCALSAGRLLACDVICTSECMCAARGLLSWICSRAGDRAKSVVNLAYVQCTWLNTAVLGRQVRFFVVLFHIKSNA